jgi:hypothetical protein
MGHESDPEAVGSGLIMVVRGWDVQIGSWNCWLMLAGEWRQEGGRLRKFD